MLFRSFLTYVLILGHSCSAHESPGQSLVLRELNSDFKCLVNDQPIGDRCNFILKECKDLSDSLGSFNYLKLYYCHSTWFRMSGLVILVALMLLYFSGLGTAASDFLCPNLHTLSKILKLSDNLAGLTLLALGNGSPDVIGTYKAMALGSGSLAISELIGATFFIISVVLGLMSIINPFQIPKYSFKRDITTLVLVVLVIFFAIMISSLTIMFCSLLIISYASYVSFILVTHSRYVNEEKRKIREMRSRGQYTDLAFSQSATDISLDDFAHLPTIDELNFDNAAHEANFEARMELGEFIESSDATTFNIGSYGLKRLIKDLGRQTSAPVFLGENIDRPLTAPELGIIDRANEDPQEVQFFTFPQTRSINSTTSRPENLFHGETEEISQLNNGNEPLTITLETRRPFADMRIKSIFSLLFPEFKEFRKYNIWNKIYTIIVIPFALLLRVTAPVIDADNLAKEPVDSELSISDFEDKFLFIQQFLAINIISLTIGYPIYIAMIASLGFCSISFALSLYKLLSNEKMMYLFSFQGFMVSLFWISFFATEIVSLIRTVSIIYDISDDILGMTVFAMGNCIGDLISNLTVTRMGMPLMALGACFGGPILSLCSLGLNGMILILRNDLEVQGFLFGFSSSLFVVIFGLFISIAIIMFGVPRNDWKIDRKLGIILISNWLATMSFCLLLEHLK